MSIDKLREEVKKNCDVDIKYISCENKFINRLSPACTIPGNPITVNVLDLLKSDERIQAEAHELAHILLREQGLVSLESRAEEELELSFLILEINNAISHKYVIDILKNKYEISSELHLKLRGLSIKNIERDIEELKNIYLQYGIGMRLYDIQETLINNEERIEELITLSTDVEHSVDVAKRWISKIDINTPRKEQEEIICNMLTELHIPKYKIKIV